MKKLKPMKPIKKLKQMKKLRIMVLSLFLLLSIISVVNANPVENFVCEIGNTHAYCNWNFNNTSSASVYVDGEYKYDTSLTNITISNLQPAEKHVIVLTNTSNASEIFAQKQIQTSFGNILFSILILVMIVLILLQFITNDEIETYIFGGIVFFIGIITSYSFIAANLATYGYITLGITITSLIWSIVTYAVMTEEELGEAT